MIDQFIERVMKKKRFVHRTKFGRFPISPIRVHRSKIDELIDDIEKEEEALIKRELEHQRDERNSNEFLYNLINQLERSEY